MWKTYITVIVYVNIWEVTMNKKLTLRLDDELIEFAKRYSAQTGKPISHIVANLFEIIKNERLQRETKLPPTVSSLRGILKGKITEADYKKYLEEKYL